MKDLVRCLERIMEKYGKIKTDFFYRSPLNGCKLFYNIYIF